MSEVDTRLAEYITDLGDHYLDVVPEEHRNKWCIIFGSGIIATASTLEESLNLHNKFYEKHIYTVIVQPYKTDITK